MSREEIDYNRVMCGTIPRMKADLDAASGDEVIFLVRAAMLAEVVSALGVTEGWEMEVEEEGETARVIFHRTDSAGDDLLRLV